MNVASPTTVHLDALEERDAETLHKWRTDSAIRDGALSYPFPTSIDAERDWMRSFAPRGTPKDICLAVRTGAGEPLLGYCQLRAIDWISGVAELGIVIGEPGVRGQGFGGRALDAFMAFAANELALRRIWLRVVEFNTPAIMMYERAGFTLEGRLVRHVMRAGALHDVLIYGREPALNQLPARSAGEGSHA